MKQNDIKSVSRALKSYISSCKANGLAKGTIGNYERIIGEYIKFVEQNGYEACTVGTASDWKVAMAEKGVKITVINSKMGMVKTFFSWAIEMELLEKNPFIPTVMPSRKSVNAAAHQPYTKLLTADEFRHILQSDRPSRVPRIRWLRNKAVLVVFLTSGIRNSELRDLTVDDLDFTNGTLTVRCGKGGKARVCAFPPIAQDAVRDYLDSGYRPLNMKSSDWLFGVADENGFHKFDRNTLSQMVMIEVERLTGRKDVRSHALRHASASYLLTSGLSVDSISALLGHASVATTAIYAERLNPKAPSAEANSVFDQIMRVV